MLVYL